jgi:hypothetical protein
VIPRHDQKEIIMNPSKLIYSTPTVRSIEPTPEILRAFAEELAAVPTTPSLRLEAPVGPAEDISGLREAA